MSKHTPTPWVYIPEHDDGEGSAIIGADGNFVAKTHTGLGDIHHANGNHIVRCVNSYEALREALLPFAEQPVGEDLSCHAGLVPMRECGRCSKILAARAALAPEAA
jgi:hypothetical protein